MITKSKYIYEDKIMEYDTRAGTKSGLLEKRKQYNLYKAFYSNNRILSNYKEQFDFIFYKVKTTQKPKEKSSGIYMKCFEQFYKNVIKPNKLPILDEYKNEVKKFMLQFMNERHWQTHGYSSKIKKWI